MVTWILCLERAESLLPSSAVRLMLVFLALLDGHGVPGTVFGTQALIGYLGGSATRLLRRRPETGLARAARS